MINRFDMSLLDMTRKLVVIIMVLILNSVVFFFFFFLGGGGSYHVQCWAKLYTELGSEAQLA